MNVNRLNDIEDKLDSNQTREKTKIVSRISIDSNTTYYIDENKDIFEKIVGEYYLIKDEKIISKVKEILYRKRDKFSEID